MAATPTQTIPIIYFFFCFDVQQKKNSNTHSDPSKLMYLHISIISCIKVTRV